MNLIYNDTIFKKDMGYPQQPINLDYVEYMYPKRDDKGIGFYFKSGNSVWWYFNNEEEYDESLEKVLAAGNATNVSSIVKFE